MRPLLILLASLAALPAQAQQPGQVCRDTHLAGQPVNPAQSAEWLNRLASRDQALMGQIAGQWFFESGTMVGNDLFTSREVQVYAPDGNWSYQDETCSGASTGQMGCSTNQGYGLWTAQSDGQGNVLITRNFSDLNRQDACLGFTVRFAGPDTMVDVATGQVMGVRMR